MTLADLHARLSDIYESVQSFDVPSPRLPIIDLSPSNERDDRDDREPLPGLRFLREEVKRDCGLLHKCLREHGNQPSASISTNAPYLIAVWDELVHARQPVAIYRMFSPQSEYQTVKVDVVADNGARWVRVNTIKNSRLMMEFREIDSYLTSSDEDEDKLRPNLAQTEFDNSVLRMGRQLLAAAKANPVSVPGPLSSSVASDFDFSVTTITPSITLRLTRLDPAKDNSADPRIEKTIRCLCDMGLDSFGANPKPAHPKLLEPTTNINLDLSTLIALVSDITHSPLPRTAQEAHARFEPPQSYLEWKKDRAKSPAHQNQTSNLFACGVDGDEGTWQNSGQHSRALAAQAIQEMQKVRYPKPGVTFWTTSEARHRCLQIVFKIGGKRERQRADALLGSTICSRTPPVPAPTQISSFPNGSAMSEFTAGMDDDVKMSGVDAYWINSRYPAGFLPLVPVRIYPSTLPVTMEDEDQQARSTFFGSLARLCTGILSQGTACRIPVSGVDPLRLNIKY
ncbi:hypothetical protein JVU11DRAFT_6146 [Chiua virens]|nr:hypothetical protein JVU11DRAFT_6146 [Chiua virens]